MRQHKGPFSKLREGGKGEADLVRGRSLKGRKAEGPHAGTGQKLHPFRFGKAGDLFGHAKIKDGKKRRRLNRRYLQNADPAHLQFAVKARLGGGADTITIAFQKNLIISNQLCAAFNEPERQIGLAGSGVPAK
jgi:hypothetical protein